MSFQKFVLESKSWNLILKEFDLSNIFIRFKWGYFFIYIYVLMLMESKVKGDIYVRLWPEEYYWRSEEEEKPKLWS